MRRPALTAFRLTELVASISLATDLGTGQPVEHALRTCRLSMANELGLRARNAADIDYVALLRVPALRRRRARDGALRRR